MRAGCMGRSGLCRACRRARPISDLGAVVPAGACTWTARPRPQRCASAAASARGSAAASAEARVSSGARIESVSVRRTRQRAISTLAPRSHSLDTDTRLPPQDDGGAGWIPPPSSWRSPFRIRFCTKEIVLFREDLVSKLRRNCILPPSSTEPLTRQVRTHTHARACGSPCCGRDAETPPDQVVCNANADRVGRYGLFFFDCRRRTRSSTACI